MSGSECHSDQREMPCLSNSYKLEAEKRNKERETVLPYKAPKCLIVLQHTLNIAASSTDHAFALGFPLDEVGTDLYEFS